MSRANEGTGTVPRSDRYAGKVEPTGAAATITERARTWAQEAGEPRQWSWPEERRLIGTRIQRIDGSVKVTGAARYSYDINRPEMCYGKRPTAGVRFET